MSEPIYTEGIYVNGAAILRDGVRMTIAEVLVELNRRAPSAEQHQSDDLPANEEIATHWCKELVAALKRLSFAAQTTGGTAGRDEELCAAINQAEEALSIGATNRALLAVVQQQQEPVGIDAATAFEFGWGLHSDLTAPGIHDVRDVARLVGTSRWPKQLLHLLTMKFDFTGSKEKAICVLKMAINEALQEPLYTHQQPPVQSLSQRMAEAGFTPRKSPKTAGGLIREDEQPQAQGEPVGIVRLVTYEGVAKNSVEWEAVLSDEVKFDRDRFKDGEQLYTQPRAAVPDGFKLVPIEPDENMVEAAFDALDNLGFDMTRNDMGVDDMKQALAKGIAAAPAQPGDAQGGEG